MRGLRGDKKTNMRLVRDFFAAEFCAEAIILHISALRVDNSTAVGVYAAWLEKQRSSCFDQCHAA